MTGAALARPFFLSLLLLLLFLLLLPLDSRATFTRRSRRSRGSGMNVIDRCWRANPNWARNRQQLAMCSIGFAGKMSMNRGRSVRRYTVTDPSDDPLKPRPGTLRYGATIRGRVWIKFQKDMQIKLHMPLLINSYTTIDGRGADVHIAHGSCILIREVSNVIIHGLRIHHCQSANPGNVVGPDGKIVELGSSDGDAIALIGASKVWIDHNTLYECQDGLIDVTRGSTWITISNNWFRNHDKVMLLGHDDWFKEDRKMKVTVAFNHFGPDCYQRMPRIRHGYAHVVNNYYEQWGSYAIGGSSNPSIRSEGNIFVAPDSASKAVTWRSNEQDGSWNWKSIRDVFKNGAYFKGSSDGGAGPTYTPEQRFVIEDPTRVTSLTKSAGVLRCVRRYPC